MADSEALGVLLSKIVVDLADMKKNLSDGRREMQDFKSMAQGVGESVKKAFAFAGIAIGIYEVASALKEFAKDAAMVGARTETLGIAMQQVGKTYGVSAASLKFYVDELKGAGITAQESMIAVTKALTTGIPLTQLKDLATRARDIAVVAGINTSEALNRMMQGIITGEQETLRRLMIQVGSTDDIYKRYAATLGKTKEELSGVEKAQAMLNEVLRLSAGFAGISAEADASVGKQVQSMARFAEEAKNSLWALFGPVMLEGVEQMTKGWKNLKIWADANQESLEKWGEGIASFIEKKIEMIVVILKSINACRELIFTALEMVIFVKVAGWVGALGSAAYGAGAGLVALSTGVKTVQAAMLGWLPTLMAVVGGLAAYGAYQTIKKPASFDQMSREEAALLGEAGVLALPKESIDEFGGYESPIPGGVLGYQSPEDRAAKAQKDAQAAIDKALKDAPKPIGKEGKGGKEATDNLLAPMLAMFKTKREAELQDAQNSLDLLKSTNDKKRAELEKSLAEGLIDGQTYYLRLQELQQAETTAALAMIDRKKSAQQKAYEESVTQLDADEKLSEEAKGIARQKLEAENKKALAKLDTEAAQARLDGEVKVTNELKRQVEVRKQYQQKTEDLNLETQQLLGAITEQEAKLQKLVLDWQRAKEEAIKAGAGPEYLTALDANLGAKQFDVKYGDTLKNVSSEFSSGVSNIINGIRQGTFDISNALIEMFNNIMMAALKPGFDALGQALTSAVKWLLNSLSSSLGGGMDWDFMYSGGAYAHGAAFSHGVRQAFAGGGIVTRPTLFPMANGMGLMGEAGEEGILPLARIGGDLGVKALFPGSAPEVTVIVNNNAPRTQASAESQPNGDVVVTIDELVGKAYARRGTLFKLINQGDKSTRR